MAQWTCCVVSLVDNNEFITKCALVDNYTDLSLYVSLSRMVPNDGLPTVPHVQGNELHCCCTDRMQGDGMFSAFTWLWVGLL